MIRLMGVCQNGEITRPAQWTSPSGAVVYGVSHNTCPQCEGHGCPAPEQTQSTALRHAAVRALHQPG